MRENILSVISLMGAVFILSILPAQVHALTPDQVFKKVKDSIVVVKTLDAKGKVKGQGSGVLLPSGKIATNCRVVEGGVSYRVGRGKQLVRASLYAKDGNKDICLLDAKRIKGKPAKLGTTAGLKVGVPVYAVGAPKGLGLFRSDGIVVQLRGGPPPFIQTTAVISPGSSGGGLFDGKGRLVGLTVLYLEGGQNLNFAMPVEWIGEVKPAQKPAAGGRGQTEWLKRYITLSKVKDWQGLLDWCSKWTKSEPKNAESWYGLGTAYVELDRYDDAIEAFREALRIKPEYAEAWNNLGMTYAKLNRYDDAIEAFRQAIRINPEYAEAWNNLGTAYEGLTRYDDAIEAFRQAIRINPEYAKAWTNLGTTYERLTRYDDAIEACRQAVRIDPEDAYAWASLVLVYHTSGNRTSALSAVRELRRLNPEWADSLFNVIMPH